MTRLTIIQTIESLRARIRWLDDLDRGDNAAVEAGQLDRREAAINCLRRSLQREACEEKAFWMWVALEAMNNDAKTPIFANRNGG